MGKKPSIAFLLSGKGDDSESDKDPESSMPESDDDGGGATAAGAAVIDAIKADDPDGLVEAFKSLMELC